MEYLILGLLMSRPMTIYKLNQSLKQGLSLIYAASYGSLQNGVKKLLKSNFITYTEVVEKGRNKKIYSISESGIEAFYEWMSQDISDKKMEVGILSRVYFLGLIEDKGTRLDIVKRMITVVERHYNHLEAYEESLSNIEVPKAYRRIGDFQLRTLNYGVGSHYYALGWLKELLNDISEDTI